MEMIYELDGERYGRKSNKWFDSRNCSVPLAIASKLNAKYAISSNNRRRYNAGYSSVVWYKRTDALDHRVPGNFWTN